jgi:putative membrane protein
MLLPGFWGVLLADEPAATTGLPHDFWQVQWAGFVGAIIFGLLSIALAVLGFKVFDWITPRIDIQRELGEKHNIAVAIVVGAIVLGICHIVAVTVK